MGFFLKTWSALPALAVATLAAGMAAAWFWGTPWLILPLFVVVVLAGSLTYWAGWGIARAQPNEAVRLMEWWVLVPIALVSLVGAGAIGLAVIFEPGTGWSVEQKKVVGAIGGAMAAFIATTWTKSAETVDASWIAGRVKKVFEKKYEGVFTSGSLGELAVFSSVQYADWTFDDRRERAAAIAAALRDAAQLNVR